MKVISSFVQFIIGVIVGLVLLTAGAFTIGYFIFVRMAVDPPKPIFAEERPKQVTATPPQTKASPPKTTGSPASSTASSPTAAEKVEEETEVLEPGTYKARVTWPQGLSVRAEPTQNAERVSGVGYNAEIIILQESEDKNWQKIRIPENGQEGWVKSGNAEKME